MILLTGGAGYIGSHLCLGLLESNVEIVVIDNLSNSDISSIKAIEGYTGKNIPFYLGCVQDEALLEEIFEKNQKITTVIHLAGLKSVKESMNDPLLYYQNNLNATLSLLQVMKKYSCYQLIFSSSATVYGIPERVPVTEDSEVSAISPYGSTKLMIEEILMNLSQANPKWRMISLRYFNPIGSSPTGILKESPRGIPENLVPYIQQVINKKLSELVVFGNDYPTPDGTCIRDYIHILDLVDGHIAAIRYLEKMKENYQVFNLGTGIGYSVLEIIQEFERQGISIKYNFGPRRPGDVPAIYANCQKAERLLEWKAKYGLKEMVQSIHNIVDNS